MALANGDVRCQFAKFEKIALSVYFRSKLFSFHIIMTYFGFQLYLKKCNSYAEFRMLNVDCRGVCLLFFLCLIFASNELLFVIILNIIIKIMFPWHRYNLQYNLAIHLLQEMNMMRMKKFLINEQWASACTIYFQS